MKAAKPFTRASAEKVQEEAPPPHVAVSLIDAQDYGNGGLGSWEWMNDDGAPIAGGAGAEPRMVRDHLNHDLGLTGLFRALP